MNIILAVNSKQIEKYISSLKEVNVLKSLKSKKNLKDDVIALNPHVVIISNYLPGEENIEDILISLVNDPDFKARIIYLYGDDDLLRKKFTNNLIDLGIYDFYCGDIDEDVINMLLFNPKTKSTVKKEYISEDEENIINQVIQRKHNFDKEEHSSPSIDKNFKNTKVSPGDTFYDDNNLFDFEEEKKLTVHFIEKIEEVVQTREKILGTIIIAVVGAGRGVGATHTAISLSVFLSRKQYKVALVEISNKNDISSLSILSDIDIVNKNIFDVNGVDYYPNATLDYYYSLIDKYNYVVLDCGNLIYSESAKISSEQKFAEIARSHKKILITGIKEWQVKDLTNTLSNNSKAIDWNIYVTFSDDERFKEFYKTLKDNVFCIHRAAYMPEPYASSDEQDSIFNNMLKDVLPIDNSINNNKKSIFTKLFKK